MKGPYQGLSIALESSIDQATDFTRTVFGERPWTAERLETFVNSTRGITVCTTGRDGLPHAAFVIARCELDRIFFTATARSVLLKNLRRSPFVAFSLTNAGQAVVGSGEAVPSSAKDDQSTQGDDEVHAPPDLVGPDWNGEVYWINIHRIFAS